MLLDTISLHFGRGALTYMCSRSCCRLSALWEDSADLQTDALSYLQAVLRTIEGWAI